jgi:predicted alpha/beta hydrolase
VRLWAGSVRWRFGRAYCLTVAALGLAAAVVFGTMAERTPPITNIQGVAATPMVRAGDWFEGTWTVNVQRLCPGTLTRWIESSRTPDWFEWQPDLKADFQGRVKSIPKLVSYPVTSFRIPSDMPAGPASYHVVGTFRCNNIGHLLIPIVVIYPPIPFTVAEKEGR